MKHLWLGQTTEVSSGFDDEFDFKMSHTLRNLQEVRLDSDESKIDDTKGSILDFNNNVCDNSDNSEASTHFMDNVHFAELEMSEADLTESREKANNSSPPPKSSKCSEVSAPHSSMACGDHEGLSKSEPVEELSVEHSSSEEVTGNSKSLIDETEYDADDMPSEIESVQSIHSEGTSISVTKSERVPSKSDAEKSENRSNSRRSRKGEHSVHSKSSKQTLSCSSRELSSLSSVSEHASTVSESSLSRRLHSQKTNQSKKSTSSRRCSSNSTGSVTQSHSKRNHQKHKSENKGNKIHTQKDAVTQTEVGTDNQTNDVLDFKHDWQRRDPSRIAAHIIDPAAIDVLTSYNPSVLAANDLMKFHMQLLQQHIQDSRRLYESYANDNINANYKYTTVEDTEKYIARNKPRVISYKEALSLIKKDE